MPLLSRDPHNPLLMPALDQSWESAATFNPGVVRDGAGYHMVYRAQALAGHLDGQAFSLSTIGYAHSEDGVHFTGRRQIIRPEHDWERYGCEDPRITRIDDTYCIFYTCLSAFPFAANGIRVAVALTRDFIHFEKHPVTPFNAKAMALFPERIGGRWAAVLTVHTDLPPAKIAIAWFDSLEQVWSEAYWHDWYRQHDRHVIALLRSHADHLEVGAPPLRTAQGWLLLYSYIHGYFTPCRRFSVEAVLLDAADPQVVRSRTAVPVLSVEREYESKGSVGDVVFPSGALVDGEALVLYYGAADTTGCAARGELAGILDELCPATPSGFLASPLNPQGFERFGGNPILAPRAEFAWEAHAVFNPAAVWLDGRVHLVYRAMAADGTSCFGYACGSDGVHFDERAAEPIYLPSAEFERKLRPGNSGCEDPRITVLGDDLYLFYTAFDGYTPRVAYSRIAVSDFVQRRWRWAPPMVITPPGIDDKDACLLPRLIGGQYVIFHRAGDCIRINRFPSLQFGDGHWVDNRSGLIRPRKQYWDNRKFGIAAPPLETPHGWLLLFHRVTQPVAVYKVEALLLDLHDPTRVVAETAATLLEPETPEERFGQTANVVFPCGAVLIGEWLYLYYGAADSVVCVARMALETLYRRLGR